MPSKKYERYFKPVSRDGFSTAGTYRGQGRIGQTSLSRTGNSCCVGTHSNGTSSINSKGLFLSRVVNPTSVFNNSCEGQCNTPVVKDVTPLTQSELLKNNVNDNMAKCYEAGKNAGTWECKGNCNAASYHIGGKKYIYEPFAKQTSILSGSEYLKLKLPSKECLSN